MTISDERLLASLDDESTQATAENGRVRRATQAWSQCMRAEGFDDDNPTALASGPWGGEPTARETKTAAADAACTSRANLAGIYFAVLAGYQREQVDANASRLARIREESGSAIEAATRIVAAAR